MHGPLNVKSSKELFRYLQGDCGVKLLTHFYLIPRLKFRVTVPSRTYAFTS
jgi:hypothetical protein